MVENSGDFVDDGMSSASSRGTGSIPRGIEVLVKKASVDREFREALMERRADVAGDIGLELEPSEIAMLSTIPGDQLAAIIDRTDVAPDSRRAFLGKVASVMLAAVGTTILGCSDKNPVTGSQPDNPVRGIQPDDPDSTATAGGIRPSRDFDETKDKKTE